MWLRSHAEYFPSYATASLPEATHLRMPCAYIPKSPSWPSCIAHPSLTYNSGDTDTNQVPYRADSTQISNMDDLETRHRASSPVGIQLSTNFFSLPSEIRNKVYEQVVVHQEPIHPFIDYGQPYELTPGLLRVNKAVCYEASSLLYSQNCFDFTMSTSDRINSFFEQIGHNNTKYIKYAYIDFPLFDHLKSHDVTLEDDDAEFLMSIQNNCGNLRTLTTSLESTNNMEYNLDALDNLHIINEALTLVATRFRIFASLQEIIVEVYEEGPSDHIRKQMKNHGWTINTKEYEQEDSERSFGYLEEYEYDYDDDRYSDDEDEYDIDNDSDFWRRAGD